MSPATSPSPWPPCLAIAATALSLLADPAGALYASRGQLELDLADLSLAGARARGIPAGAPWPSTPLLSARLLDGSEVACLNCNTELFSAWVEDLSGGRAARNGKLGCGPSKGLAREGDGGGGAGKHPNAPGYDAWSHGKRSSFLGGRAAARGGLDAAAPVGGELACNVTVSYLQTADMEAMKPRLHQLWVERRLVVGSGLNPLHQRLGFAEVLMKLARSSPALTADCQDGRVPSCGALLSELQPVAKVWQLHEALGATFGSSFLKEQAFDARLSASEQRRRVQTLLSALKHSFVFYRQGCLSTGGAGRCKADVASQLLGQIACSPEDDTDAGVCVYAELRRCRDCSSTAQPFFEYARMHGPLALLGTRNSRSWVMGQCEEFSRAGYALLASLGYTARYVLDFTDHVWVEVRLPNSTGGLEWVHADPSEGVLDSPLMYEKGWGKQLTMIFAFTPWSVEHVTARYTADYQASQLRRGIPEEALEKVLAEVNERLKHELPIHSWGYGTSRRSSNRTLEDLSLWSHF